MVSGAPDFTKVMRGQTDEMWIKGVVMRDPYISASKPVSVENPALAYELLTDRFKVKIEQWAAGVIAELDPRVYDLFNMMQRCDKLEFAYDGDKDITTIKVYDGVTLKMTLTFTYDADKDITSIVRS